MTPQKIQRKKAGNLKSGSIRDSENEGKSTHDRGGQETVHRKDTLPLQKGLRKVGAIQRFNAVQYIIVIHTTMLARRYRM